MGGRIAEENRDDNPRTDWEYRYKIGDAGWDQGRPAPAVNEALEFFAPESRILVPGCGFGHDAAALAAAGHSVEGWDLARTAIEGARKRYGSDRLEFFERNLFESEQEDAGVQERFDAVFEHTFLCAVGPDGWEKAVRSFANLLHPEGRVFAVLFTALEERSPPPWGISEEQAHRLFSPLFLVESVAKPREAFDHRLGEETVWKLRKK
ncbi:MAG: methyltransferase domain-containing protein [Verrucomicrobiota bacterium]